MAHWYLIHGAASSRLTWTRQMRALPSVNRAALPPLTDAEPQRLVEAWADWCLDDLPEPSIVMGHSLGGAIAQTMALKAPHKVLGLVLVGTGPRLPVNPQLLDMLENSPQKALEQITRWSHGRHADPLLLANSLKQAEAVDPKRALREFLACRDFDLRSRLQEIESPKALIGGQDDRMTPLTLMEEFRKSWPNVPLYVVPDAGHMMMLEQPDVFNSILTQITEDFSVQ